MSNLHPLQTLHTNLSSKIWRMNNLYHIRDKDSNLMLLRLNHAQKVTVLNYRHNKKIILKSRQQGISTLYVAYYLDDCLFKDGFMAGIQSYGKDESKKLSARALLMWNELDPLVKQYLGVKLTASNSNGLTFSNGSELKIGNFRGDTLQGLHVSELAKISIKYPEKARELKTGAFQAVSANSKISIETTAEGDTGLFVEIWNKAKAKELAMSLDPSLQLTPLDFQAIFLPWFNDPDCQLTIIAPTTSETLKYMLELTEELVDAEKEGSDSAEAYGLEYSTVGEVFKGTKELGKLLVQSETKKSVSSKCIALSAGQVSWLTIKLDELGDDFNQEYPATPERAFRVSVQGTYFMEQLKVLRKQKRIVPIKYNPKYQVHVSFDLGLNDEMVLLFAQIYDGKTYLIDEYHNTGYGIPYYIEVMQSKPYNYNYGYIILPHDANVKDMSTGRTRVDLFRRYGFTQILLLERLSFQESIEVGRSLVMDKTTYINSECLNTISALQNYRKKFDKALGVFLNTDVHDIHSNYGASLRYLAQGLSSQKVANTNSNRFRNTFSYSGDTAL